jgi:hypothetical protein
MNRKEDQELKAPGKDNSKEKAATWRIMVQG